MKFKPSKIYVIKKIKDFPVTQRILNHPSFAGIERIIVDSPQEIQQEYLPAKGSTFYKNTTKNIKIGRHILALKRGAMPIVVEEPARSGVVSMQVYRNEGGRLFNVKLGGMCINNCHYCYLYSANKLHPEVAVYVDVEAMKQGMTKEVSKANGLPVTFNAGEHTDSLALDPIKKITTDLVPFVPSLTNAMLELRTKSAEIANLKGLDHQGKTIAAWSLAPQKVIRQTEGGDTTSFAKRLNAMKEVQEWGYPIALKIDPIIPVDGWKQVYRQMIKKIGETIRPESVHHYAVGVLRMNGMLKKLLPVLFPNSIVNSFDMSEKRKGKYTHPGEQRRGIYLFILRLMKEAYPEAPYYISMEDTDFAENIMDQVGR